MARSKANEGDARTRLVEPAAGFAAAIGGTGVDALAKGAGLTSGAFYAHFRFARLEAFRLVVSDGIAVLRNGVAAFQQQARPRLARSLCRFLSRRTHGSRFVGRLRATEFSPDVARADDATRAVYEEELTRLVELVAAGFRGAHADQRAWSFLAVLSGAAAMARAVKDARVRREILTAAGVAAKAI